MKASNFFSFALTGLAVKTYMLIGIVWSKSNEQYKYARTFMKQATSTTHPTPSHQ